MSMPLDDAIFWIGLTIFGTGLYLMPDYKAWGIALITVGTAGIVLGIRAHLRGVSRMSGISALLMLLTWAAIGFDYIDRRYHPLAFAPLTTAQSTPNPTPISGTKEVPSITSTVDVKTDIEMPYSVFCTTDWGSPCVLHDRKQGVFTLQFSTPAPFIGGTVEYTIIPMELKEAYQKEADTIDMLNIAVERCERGLNLEQVENQQNLGRQTKTWSDYQARVMAVIGDIEKEGCTQQTNNKLDTLRNGPP